MHEISEATKKRCYLTSFVLLITDKWYDDNNKTTSFFIHVLGIGLKLYIKRVYFLLCYLNSIPIFIHGKCYTTRYNLNVQVYTNKKIIFFGEWLLWNWKIRKSTRYHVFSNFLFICNITDIFGKFSMSIEGGRSNLLNDALPSSEGGSKDFKDQQNKTLTYLNKN